MNALRTIKPHFEADIHFIERESMVSFRAAFVPPVSKIDALKPRTTGFSQLSTNHPIIFNPLENKEHDFSNLQDCGFFHKYSKPPTIKNKMTEDDDFPLKISQIPLSESVVVEDVNTSSKSKRKRGIIANELKSFLGFLVKRMVDKGEQIVKDLRSSTVS